MGRRQFGREFKLEAVRLVSGTRRGRGARAPRRVRGWHVLGQPPAPSRLPLLPQQAAAHVVPPRHVVELRSGLIMLGEDPQLLLGSATPTPLNPRDDLHPAPVWP